MVLTTISPDYFVYLNLYRINIYSRVTKNQTLHIGDLV